MRYKPLIVFFYSVLYSKLHHTSEGNMATPGMGVQSVPGNRQRLRPWLINQINSGNYPGVSWIDHETMAFKIPWKHFGKPGVNEEKDAKIFREWAKHTGKYKDGDPSDASTWKTRFRCALYKLQDIEELPHLNMLDGDDPYRVYRFRSKGGLGWSQFLRVC